LRPRRRALLLLAAFALAREAHAGAQQYEVLSASVRATLAHAVNERATIDEKDLDTRAWVRAMTRRVAGHFPDEEGARHFLAMVRYEATRAGLDPHLVLALIDVESKFRKYAVSRSGARGLMQVMPFWVKEIGDARHNLFHERTNLRYGCVILRHYLDIENGDVFRALGRYNGSLGRSEYPDAVMAAMTRNWLFAQDVSAPTTAPTVKVTAASVSNVVHTKLVQ